MDQVAVPLFEEMQARVANPGPFFEMAGDRVLFPAFQENILTAGHGTWAPLAPVTVAEKIRVGSSTPNDPLLRFGGLIGSLQRGAPDNVFRMEGNQAEFGTSREYAIYHQAYGPRRKLPERAFIAIDDADFEDLKSLLGRWVLGLE